MHKNKAIRYIFLIIGILIILVVVVESIYDRYSLKRDEKLVEVLETKVIPFVKENNISFFFDMDWCQVLDYKDRLVSNTVSSTSPEDCGTRFTGGNNPSSFTEVDWELFNQTKVILNSSSNKTFTEIAPEFPLSYRPEHASLKRESIGLGFHVKCDFCRTRYVYSPGYTYLPPNIEREIEYIPINANWYKVEQDWN